MQSLVITRAQAERGGEVEAVVKNRQGKYVVVSVVIDPGQKNRSKVDLVESPSGSDSLVRHSARIRIRDWRIWNGIAAVAGIAGVIGYAWKYVIAFCVIWGIFCFCAKYSRENNAGILTGKFWRKFLAVLASSAERYLVAADIAIGIFLILAMVVTRFRDSFSIGQLRWLHEFLSEVSDFWDQWIKLNDVWLLVVYLAIWVLTSLLLLWHGQYREASKGKVGPSWRYRIAKMMRQAVGLHDRYSGPVSIMLALLASFTFIAVAIVPVSDQLHSQLALRLSQRAEQIHAQEVKNARNYQQAAQRVTADINALVISRLDTRVQESMPSSYRKVLSEYQFQSQADKISGEAHRLGVSLHRIDPDAARAVAAENARVNNLEDAPGELTAPKPKKPVLYAVPSTLTSRQAEAARKWTETDTNDDTIDLITESDNSVQVQVGTLFVSGPMWDAIKKVVKAWFPSAELIVDALSGTVGDQLQEAVYEKVRPIVQQIMNQAGDVQQRISSAAREISDKVNVRAIVGKRSAEAESLAAEREADLSTLSSAASRVKYEVDAKIAQERDTIVRQSIVDPVDLEASPSSGGLIQESDFDSAVNGTLASSEAVQAEVVKRLVGIAQLSDSDLQALWQSYGLQVDPSTGYLVTNIVEGGGQITMAPATLKQNASHVIQYLAPQLQDVISAEDLDVANANCGCS